MVSSIIYHIEVVGLLSRNLAILNSALHSNSRIYIVVVASNLARFVQGMTKIPLMTT